MESTTHILGLPGTTILQYMEFARHSVQQDNSQEMKTTSVYQTVETTTSRTFGAILSQKPVKQLHSTVQMATTQTTPQVCA